MHVRKETKAITYTDKALQPTTSSDQFTALTQFYLQDTAPPTFIQKKGKRPPSKTRAPDRVRRPLCGVEPG